MLLVEPSVNVVVPILSSPAVQVQLAALLRLIEVLIVSTPPDLLTVILGNAPPPVDESVCAPEPAISIIPLPLVPALPAASTFPNTLRVPAPIACVVDVLSVRFPSIVAVPETVSVKPLFSAAVTLL